MANTTIPVATDGLQFQPFSSFVEVSFWGRLSRNKLDEYKLDTTPQPLVAAYAPATHAQVPSRMCLGDYSFDGITTTTLPVGHYGVSGTLYNANTKEDFGRFDKAKLMQSAGAQIWKDVISGDALKNPSLLSRFVLLTFADLKSHQHTYWFCFAGLVRNTLNLSVPVAPSVLRTSLPSGVVSSISRWFSAAERATIPALASPFFLISITGDTARVLPFSAITTSYPAAAGSETLLAFIDPCALATNPGWPLRNLLAAVSHYVPAVTTTRVVCLRALDNLDVDAKEGFASCSIVLSVKLDTVPAKVAESVPKTVGWERNREGKLGERTMDLQAMMDPVKLAENSVDLNLKLMRWRMLPALDLPMLANTRCLLLGAGTLGCAVARTLMGWGVRNINFVDYGKVSYSNPVRQSLFTFEDAKLGKQKADTAAEAVTKIFPGTISTGHRMTIPMPGHPVTASEQAEVQKDVAALTDLIKTHDVIFLLTDSRESRWLPTMLCAAYGKMCINTALGFDNYVVMRHGANYPEADTKEAATAAPSTPAVAATETKVEASSSSSGYGTPYDPIHTRLGCYFCNDVVAPSDSLSERSLDQQCTVTRPGLAFIASALAVELAVATLHHPQRQRAPADGLGVDNGFGNLPHQLRGYLTRWDVQSVLGQSFDKCTACSPKIVETYRANGWSFILDALNKPTFLEDLTGLTQLKKDADAANWQVEDEDDDF